MCLRVCAFMCAFVKSPSVLLLLLPLCVSLCAAVSHPCAVPAAVRPHLPCSLENASSSDLRILRVIG